MADAFGQMLLDGTGPELIERDHGFVDAAKIGYSHRSLAGGFHNTKKTFQEREV